MKKVITISREFGSGGRSIGKAVAQKLGYQYYDKEIIEQLAEKTGLSKQYIEESGEYARSSNIFSYAFVGRTVDGQSMEDFLWRKQSELIRELADKGNCVIVGRCADYLLSDRTDCLNVFIHASMEYKKERIVKMYGETDQKPEKRLREKDKKRSANYKYYTDQQWGYGANYHLCLDSSEFGEDKCVDIICQLL